MRFNTAISALMILANVIASEAKQSHKIKSDRTEAGGIALSSRVLGTSRNDNENLEKFLILLSPFAPHIAEELWQKLGHRHSIIKEKWPEADVSKLQSETVEFVVQINGKLRAKISLPPDISEAEAVAAVKDLDNVKKYLTGQEIKKTIFVPGRMISFVV